MRGKTGPADGVRPAVAPWYDRATLLWVHDLRHGLEFTGCSEKCTKDGTSPQKTMYFPESRVRTVEIRASVNYFLNSLNPIMTM